MGMLAGFAGEAFAHGSIAHQIFDRLFYGFWCCRMLSHADRRAMRAELLGIGGLMII